MTSGCCNLLVITGPTASGKTRLGAVLAKKINGEIISGDSRQVYRDMDIGTGKDLRDFIVEGEKVPYHLIDIRNPGEKYNVFEFQQDFIRVYEDIRARGKMPVLVGGSGLYIEAVLRGYKLIKVPIDPAFRATLEDKTMKELADMLASYKKLHNITDLDTRKRVIRALEIEHYYASHPEKEPHFPELNPLIFGLRVDRETRRTNISQRLYRRLKEGMIEEVETLLNKGVSFDTLIYYGLEYKYIALYLKGELFYDEMVRKLETAIHQFAKRQMTWFRGMEKRGVPILWIDGNLPLEKKLTIILEKMEERE
ncbi:MAG TPA: tRNA (adenosine(37)-N6)-dimethylallyltransferase MiaA [Bacteroidetes bacterium]|nr:tRNA (adenosine(37)-N6)-dimethylallyltransferase MiaA [Bacteroidota bacterium]